METRGRRPIRARSDAEAAPALTEESAPVETPAAPPLVEPETRPSAEVAAAEVAAPEVAVPEVAAPEVAAPEGISDVGREAVEALVASQAAAARGWEAISDELAGLARTGIDIAAHAATEMLGVKTISDACKVNASFARKSFDSLLDGSAKLSRLGIKLAAESSRPILTQFGEGWIRAVRLAL
jgi:hypothetical protein